MFIKIYGAFIKVNKLAARPDDPDEALGYHKYGIRIYKNKYDGCYELVGHAPAEISSFLYHFLRTRDDNYVEVGILGERKHEAGLVLPVMLLRQKGKLQKF